MNVLYIDLLNVLYSQANHSIDLIWKAHSGENPVSSI